MRWRLLVCDCIVARNISGNSSVIALKPAILTSCFRCLTMVWIIRMASSRHHRRFTRMAITYDSTAALMLFKQSADIACSRIVTSYFAQSIMRIIITINIVVISTLPAAPSWPRNIGFISVLMQAGKSYIMCTLMAKYWQQWNNRCWRTHFHINICWQRDESIDEAGRSRSRRLLYIIGFDKPG